MPRAITGPMTSSFEIFDHTADAGIRIRAATLPELIQPATDGLYTCIGELVGSGNTAPFRFERTEAAPDAATLLRDYLQELLVLFETRTRRLSRVQVGEFTSTRIAVAGESQVVDETRSVYYREVKAVTYHELAIREIPGGYEATVIVDI